MTTLSPQPADASAAARPARHWLAAALAEALGRAGARVGSVWVLAMVSLAVFAPFIANSMPLAVKMDGRWSSPLIEHLTAADVCLVIVFVAGLVLLPIKRLRFLTRLGVFVGIVAVSAVVCFSLIPTPQAVTWEQYRVLQAEGELESVVWAPIPYSPNDALRDEAGVRHPLAPQSPHWLGTDRFGPDILSQMIHATRIALAVGFIAESLSAVIGIIIGGLMGYFAGWVDLLGLRLVEVFSAIPRLFLLLAFVAVFDRNIYLIMAIIGVTGWTGYAYFTRAEFLRLRKQDYVQAAIATATPLRSILFKHMLPNGMAPVLVSAGFGVASAILYESTLSFLGLGVVDQPSWGDLLNQAVAAGGGFYWWLATFPGFAIFMTVFAFNLIGEALRDAIDPHTKKAAQI
jgi:peptide/nickel transport system permease protein